MKSHTHLTEHERYHIHMMNGQSYTLTEIARTMDRDKSTISREIKRNTGGNGYRHKQAHNRSSRAGGNPEEGFREQINASN